MDILSIQVAILFLLTIPATALMRIGFENLLAGIITFAVGIWMLSFGLLLRFNHTPGPHPMRINGYILVILGIFAVISNLSVIIASLATPYADAALFSYGIPSIVGLILSAIVVYLAYNYVTKYKNFKRKIGTYIILIGLFLVICAVVNFYYYYLFLELQYYLLTHPSVG
jgi:hypothetical protein